MKIFKINNKNISQAVAILKNGGVIVYPTDTAYALGGIFDSKKVKQKILKIKNRQDDKFTLVASSFNQVNKYFKLNFLEKKIAKKYWPGPLSLVVSSKYSIRVPNNDLARKIARQVCKPLIATSANLTGKKTLYDSQAIIKEFLNKKNQPDLIIDAGRLKKIKTSTIVKVNPDSIDVIRAGAIKNVRL